jgi:hypothetical protein
MPSPVDCQQVEVERWLTGCVVMEGAIEELLKVMLQKVVLPVVVIAAT